MNLKTSKTLQVKKCPEILSPTVGLIHIIDINATEVTRISDLIMYKNTGLQKKTSYKYDYGLYLLWVNLVSRYLTITNKHRIKSLTI